MDFGSQNGIQNPLKKQPLICLFLASVFWEFWLHFGNQFLHKMGGACGEPSVFFGSMLFFGVLVVRDPSWPGLGSILEGLDLDVEGFGTPFWDVFVTTWLPYALQCWSFLAVLF